MFEEELLLMALLNENWVFKKDHFYWARYKYAPNTLTVAMPGTIREGRVQFWWLPYSRDAIGSHRTDELEIIAEIPFPEGYDRGR